MLFGRELLDGNGSPVHAVNVTSRFILEHDRRSDLLHPGEELGTIYQILLIPTVVRFDGLGRDRGVQELQQVARSVVGDVSLGGQMLVSLNIFC